MLKATITHMFVHSNNSLVRWTDHVILNGEIDVPMPASETSLTANCAKRRRKDPLRPRGYMSAFNFFARDCRSRLLNENPSLQVRCRPVGLSMLSRSGCINRPKQQHKQDSREKVEGAVPTEASCVRRSCEGGQTAVPAGASSLCYEWNETAGDGSL